MRSALLGLTVPLLLLAAASVTLVPPASAQTTTYEVSGRVVSDAGEPIEGAQVNGYTWHNDPYRSSFGSNDHAITDEDGRFTLELAEGRGSISVYYEKWRANDHREIDVDEDIDDLTFTLVTPPPKTAIITGVVLGDDGEPVANAQVNLQYRCCYAMPAYAEPAAETNSTEGSPGSVEPSKPRIAPSPAPYPYYYHDDHQTATTDDDGRFRFETYGGPRQVMAWARGYAQTSVEVDAVDGETVEVEVELVKVPERNAILEGRIVDAQTGLPLSGATVSARSLEWGRWAEARTDSDGRYTLRTVPGWTEISVHYWAWSEPMPIDAAASDGAAVDIARPIPAPNGPQYFPHMRLVDLESGDADLDVRLEPKPRPTIALVGYVVDPTTDEAVEGARVSVWNSEGGDWGEATTDATGSFRIMVRAGHYTGNAWKEGYLGGSQSFIVTSEPVQRVDLLMPKGTTRWAPCYDENDCGPVIMYAGEKAYDSDEAAADGNATTASTAPTMPAAAGAPAPSALAPQARAESDAAATGRSGTATFQGSGGGLPAYDPGSKDAVPAAQGEAITVTNPVPGIGLLALAGIGAALALAIRDRRS